ncbi:hypothetical protein GHK50_10060 [Sinorhizobium medicae]|uniref:Uncharacterized protein n=1 Tax=Sinorhizobium medicae TaxID=110321 RepID=A0A6G1WS28_9HYPH|nr:hypothetical protein [Sinorhizobium medicae]MQX83440.1 hypothetical protein [Sinorhizobium medicae]
MLVRGRESRPYVLPILRRALTVTRLETLDAALFRATELTGPLSYSFLLKSKYNYLRAVCNLESYRSFPTSDSAAGVMREILQRIEAGRRDGAQLRR